MSKSGRKKNADTDVLRAGDVVPPYGDKSASAKKKTKRKKAPSSGKPAPAKTAKTAAKSKKTATGRAEIPILDLDKQILAKQRKVTSVRRKGPGLKAKASAKAGEPVLGEIADMPVVPELAERDRVIAEIVARDIRRLCEG